MTLSIVCQLHLVIEESPVAQLVAIKRSNSGSYGLKTYTSHTSTPTS